MLEGSEPVSTSGIPSSDCASSFASSLILNPRVEAWATTRWGRVRVNETIAAVPFETPKTSMPRAETSSTKSVSRSSAINSTRPRARSDGLVIGSFSARGVIFRAVPADKSNKRVRGGHSESFRLWGKS